MSQAFYKNKGEIQLNDTVPFYALNRLTLCKYIFVGNIWQTCPVHYRYLKVTENMFDVKVLGPGYDLCLNTLRTRRARPC